MLGVRTSSFAEFLLPDASQSVRPSWSMSLSNTLIRPRGTQPVIELPLRCRYSSISRLPRTLGIDPPKLLSYKNSRVRLGRSLNEYGIPPVRSLPARYNVSSLVSLPSSRGIGPDSRLCPRLSCCSSIRSPSQVGTGPVRSFSHRYRTSSLVRPAISGGMAPVRFGLRAMLSHLSAVKSPISKGRLPFSRCSTRCS